MLLVCKFYAPTQSFKLKDVEATAVNVGTSVANIGTSVVNIGLSAVNIGVNAVMGVADKIPEVIPSAEVFFQSAKNLIVGYPFEQVNI